MLLDIWMFAPTSIAACRKVNNGAERLSMASVMAICGGLLGPNGLIRRWSVEYRATGHPRMCSQYDSIANVTLCPMVGSRMIQRTPIVNPVRPGFLSCKISFNILRICRRSSIEHLSLIQCCWGAFQVKFSLILFAIIGGGLLGPKGEHVGVLKFFWMIFWMVCLRAMRLRFWEHSFFFGRNLKKLRCT